MKTPQRVTVEALEQLRDDWLKEFIGNEVGKTAARCLKCGSIILAKNALISIHVREFETCSGSGHVERLPIPFCPHCEPEPASYGCIHIPIQEDMMGRPFNLRIQ